MDYYHQTLTAKRAYDESYLDKYRAFDRRLTRRLNQIRLSLVGLPYNSSLVDFGCGTGSFVETCWASYDAYGFDVKELPKGVRYRDPHQDPADIVTFFDSLEHIDCNYDCLVDFVNTLKTNNLLISIPWCHKATKGDSWFNTWRHKRPDEHVHHFGAAGMCQFLHDAGFKATYVGNPEDVVRVGQDHLPNILTVRGVRI
jgi:SAM-dependent methyltransferase